MFLNDFFLRCSISAVRVVDNTLTIIIASAVGGAIAFLMAFMLLKNFTLFVLAKLEEKKWVFTSWHFLMIVQMFRIVSSHATTAARWHFSLSRTHAVVVFLMLQVCLWGALISSAALTRPPFSLLPTAVRSALSLLQGSTTLRTASQDPKLIPNQRQKRNEAGAM